MGSPGRKFLRDLVGILAFALLIFFVSQYVVVRYVVNGESMEPNLQTGEQVLVVTKRLAYLFSEPKRGDIIVFHPPRNVSGEPFIKRVIGIPGDVVEIRNGRVYINGKLLPENGRVYRDHCDYGPVVVPPGKYFVLGDNRPHSIDSPEIGFVDEDAIVGKAWLCIWPPSRWGKAPNFDYNSLLEGSAA